MEIRADDVLQVKPVSKYQKRALQEKSFYEWFMEADLVFSRFEYPCILAVLSEGIDVEPHWVDYIQRNQHRYIIELHGLDHRNYSRCSEKELYNLLREARDKIQLTFGVKVTTWYVPFGRKGKNPYGEKVCKKLGIKQYIPDGKVDAKLWLKNRSMPHINFHFWKRSQINDINEIVHQLRN